MILHDLAATETLAQHLARLARPGDALLLSGPLGAGKSALARAFLRALLGDPALEVPSPSYTLVQSYAVPGGGQAHHFDLYRLGGAEEVLELGWDEALEGIMLVEWPERLGAMAPKGALCITLTPLDEDRRLAQLTGWEGRL
ncbi:MAG: tRNA (adenosine(37)-N6)-threonylcarbamoyltransferase complex ATPase subunit type 1 TsaE [Alphaproteobacteria bacterium]|nr:tRNA (adenosine(37)-N6)-threonylcarbamoyltransferase complex ATPase subunit type 1 TsaE [Alphaproteobacteria bacterium]